MCVICCFKWLVRGQWRDTVPPIAEVRTFRFIAADYPGETVLHCHFQRHEDLGMMDSYLVTDPASYSLINTAAPSAAPSPAPSAVRTAAPTPSPSIVDPASAASGDYIDFI